MIRDRIAYIDNIKFVAIVLVILGHCCWLSQIPLAYGFIYSFHMPLFFIISGFFIKPITFRSGLGKYGMAYLRPYVLTMLATAMVIMFVDFLLVDHYDFGDHIKELFIRYGFGSGSFNGNELFATMPIVGPLWFLLALFWACLIYGYLISNFKGTNLLIVVFSIFVLSRVLIHYVRLPFSVLSGLSAIIFVYAGNQIKNNNLYNARLTKTSLIGILFIWSVCSAVGGLHVSHLIYNLGMITVFGSILICLLIIQIAHKFERSIRVPGGGYFGSKTLYILCSHQLVLYIHYMYGNPFEYLSDMNIICALLVEFLIELSLALIGAMIINKTVQIYKRVL